MTDEERLEWYEAEAEKAYAALYDATHANDIIARYSNAKEGFHSAIAIAYLLGRSEEAQRLEARLAHVKAVFRSQFG